MMVENSYYERDVLIEAYAKDVLAVTVKLLVWSLDRHSYHLSTIQSKLMTLMCTQIDIPYNKKLCDLILEVFMKIDIKNTPSPLQTQDVDKAINCIAPWILSNTHNEEARELNEIIQQTLPYVCEQGVTVEAVDCLLKKVKELKQRAEKPQEYCLYIIVDYVSKVKLVFDPERADPTKIKKVNHLLVICYDFLLWTCKDNPLICQKLWHYARQFYLLTCDNSSVNYLHIHLVLLTVCQLGPHRLTPYSIELFAEILQKFGDYFTEDAKKIIIDTTVTNKKRYRS